MTVSVKVTVRNRLLHADPVKSARVSINVPAAAGTGVSGATNHHGVAALTTTGIPDGNWVLGVTPADTSADAVGPATASGSTTPDRIFRSLTVNVTTTKGKITAVGWPSPTRRPGRSPASTTRT